MLNLFNKKINKILAVVAVLVAVAVIAVIVVPRFLQKQKPTSQSSGTQGAQNKTQRFNYEPGITTILQGAIQEISEDSLEVKTIESEKNPVLQNRIFEVVISTSTEFFLLDRAFYFAKNKEETRVLPLPMPGENDGKKGSTWQRAALSALQKDDVVVVVGGLKGEDTFAAKQIYKREF